MTAHHVFITGSNRGVGLALATHYASQPGLRVTASCRRPEDATKLQSVAAGSAGRVFPQPLDMNSDDSIHAAAAARPAGQPDALDLLILNAGINAKGKPGASGIGALSRDLFGEILLTNALSPLMVVQALLPRLEAGVSEWGSAGIVFVSSQMGSIGLGLASRVSAYSSSKAAENMIAAGLARELLPRGIIVITMHPGHVATDMGGATAPVSPPDSAAGIAGVIAGIGPQDAGAFIDWKGERLPW